LVRNRADARSDPQRRGRRLDATNDEPVDGRVPAVDDHAHVLHVFDQHVIELMCSS
jgi:hypothetical protein